MKKISLYCLLSLFVIVLSCNNNDNDDGMSTDDDGMSTDDGSMNTDDDTQTVNQRYYSLEQEDTWTYDITTNDMEPTQDMLTVTGTTIIENDEYSTFTASEVSSGFITTVIAGGALLETDTQLIYTGSFVLPLEDNELEIPLIATPLYDQTADVGTELFSQVETIVQEIEQDGLTIPLTITTTLATIQGNIQEDVIINGFSFDSVLGSSITISANITAEVLGIQLTVLEEQPVIAINNLYASNVGLVESTTNLNYEFEDLSALGIELPFPLAGSSQSMQIVTSYDVAADD